MPDGMRPGFSASASDMPTGRRAASPLGLHITPRSSVRMFGSPLLGDFTSHETVGWIPPSGPRAIAIPGFRTVEQVEGIAGAVIHGPVSPEQMSAIDVLLEHSKALGRHGKRLSPRRCSPSALAGACGSQTQGSTRRREFAGVPGTAAAPGSKTCLRCVPSIPPRDSNTRA